jgi:hypothetical protein
LTSANGYCPKKASAKLPIIPLETALLILGAATVLFCIPLLRGMVKSNRLDGIRVAAAFTREENWYRISRYGAKCLIG